VLDEVEGTSRLQYPQPFLGLILTPTRSNACRTDSALQSDVRPNERFDVQEVHPIPVHTDDGRDRRRV